MARALGLSVQDLQNVFDTFDDDGNGGIDAEEFGALLAALDVVWDDYTTATALKNIDQDGNGIIDFKEFCSWWLTESATAGKAEWEVYDEMQQKFGGMRYVWDPEASEQDNIDAQQKYYEELDQKRDEFYQDGERAREEKKDIRMLRGKLMIPLYVKKIARVIEGLTDKRNLRVQEIMEETADPAADPDTFVQLFMALWDLFKHAGNVVRGIKSATFQDDMLSAGAEFKDLLFMDFLPHAEDIENASTDRVNITDKWFMQWAAHFQGADTPRPDDAINSLVGEFGEIVDVIKAAYPLMDCVNRDLLNDKSGGIFSKAEDEAKTVFNLV